MIRLHVCQQVGVSCGGRQCPAGQYCAQGTPQQPQQTCVQQGLLGATAPVPVAQPVRYSFCLK